MSETIQADNGPFLPDRLSIAEFNPREIVKIMGSSVLQHGLAKENFNWLAAYLVEEIGLYEGEVVEWFKSNAKGLGGQRPLDVWDNPDGFVEVFDYAQEFKAQVAEDLGRDYLSETYQEGVERSQRMGLDAMKIISLAFEGINITDTELAYGRDLAVYNPARGVRLVASWRRGSVLQHYRIDRQNPDRTRLSRYFVVFGSPEGRLRIFQTGIGEFFNVDGKHTDELDSDIDGRPPTAGQVASFVIPLANEVKNGSLVKMQP